MLLPTHGLRGPEVYGLLKPRSEDGLDPTIQLCNPGGGGGGGKIGN